MESADHGLSSYFENHSPQGKAYSEKACVREYIKFCMEEKEFFNPERRHYLTHLAALHGHLPLLQELLKYSDMLDPFIIMTAGESSFAQSLLVNFGF